METWNGLRLVWQRLKAPNYLGSHRTVRCFWTQSRREAGGVHLTAPEHRVHGAAPRIPRVPAPHGIRRENWVKHWLLQLATELGERLSQDREQNKRVGKQLSVGCDWRGTERPPASPGAAPCHSTEHRGLPEMPSH
uniref:uncharacterized protein isoform X1 n=1 Tax=Pristiophorus japonicus TaxID=55135 RepID=UPI00398F262A